MIDTVIKNYFPKEKIYCVTPFGNGHINDTYKIEFEVSSNTYILQRINTLVFNNPEIIVNNHIKLQKEISNISQPIQIAQIVPDKNGNHLFIDKYNGAWRMTTYIPNSFSIDLVDENWQAYESGKGYGWFINACSALNTDDFQEPIKDFQRLSFRLNQLKKAIKEDKVKRLNSVIPIIEFYEQREKSLLQIEELIDKGEIPLRLVHNDTKINNILFRNKQAVAVIDLDTVGPGSILFDYGDALRTSANTSAEDERNLEKVAFNMNAFNAFSEGYLSQVKNILTKNEKEYLHLAPVLMTYIMGIRFLADYLNGDIYYKTAYNEHNIDRCKVQKKLIESIEQNAGLIKNSIAENLKSNE